MAAQGIGFTMHRFATTDGDGPLPQLASVQLNHQFTTTTATASGGTNNAGVVVTNTRPDIYKT